ncbi:hypothetical protein ACVPOR_07235 [Staphylococcus aureus]
MVHVLVQFQRAITQQKVEQVVKDSGLKADQIQINGKDNKDHRFVALPKTI